MLRFIEASWRPALKVLGILLVFAAAYHATVFVSGNDEVREFVQAFGYFGVFIASIIAGFNIVVPVPVAALVPIFVESGLSLWLVIIVSVLGTTFADTAAYALGYYGREITVHWNRKKLLARMDVLRERHYWIPVAALFFYAAFVPFPNELLLVPLGFAGYAIRHLFIAYFLGNVVFVTLSSLGVVGLFKLF